MFCLEVIAHGNEERGGRIRRESGVTSILRSKTLAQAEFISAEQVKSKGFPQNALFLWDGSEFATT